MLLHGLGFDDGIAHGVGALGGCTATPQGPVSLAGEASFLKEGTRCAMVFFLAPSTPFSHELEAGTIWWAKERETEDGTEEEHLCIWVRLWNAYHKYYMDPTWWPLRRGGASRWRSDLENEHTLELCHH